jgi:hypothetical protein
MTPQHLASGILSLLSLGASIAFTWIGVEMLLESGAPMNIRLFGAITITYVALNLFLLVAAWRGGRRSLEVWARFVAAGYFSAILMSAIEDGNLESMDQSALVLSALMLFVNWLAIRRTVGSLSRAF